MTKDNQNQDSKLKVYELAMLVDPKLSEDKVADKVATLGDKVTQESGEVLSSGNPTMRNLAYEITVKTEGKRRDYTKAYFTWIKIEIDPATTAQIEKLIKADAEIIRHLLIHAPREDYVTTLTDEDPIEEDEAEDEDEDEDSDDETEGEIDEDDK